MKSVAMKSAAFSAIITITVTFAALVSFDAAAHVTLEQAAMEVGSTGKLVLRVPHGCDGSPTTAITVFLPEGLVGAKPMPKPGWILEITSEKLAAPYDSHGTPISERPAQITWKGGHLLDAEYDEFIVRASLQGEPGKRYLRVLQVCEKGQSDWARIPVPGQTRPALPALELEVTPSNPHLHHH